MHTFDRMDGIDHGNGLVRILVVLGNRDRKWLHKSLLAEPTRLHPFSVTTMLSQLSKAGWAENRPDKSGKWRITEAGEVHLAEAMKNVK